MPFHFANVLLFSATAILFVFGSLLAGRFLRPHAPNREKSMIYECGEKPIGQAWFNFNPRFYLIALVFVIFDVELAFVYPVVAVFRKWIDEGRGAFALAEIAVFVGILFVGLVYVWVKGDLEWLKRIPVEAEDVERPAPREAA